MFFRDDGERGVKTTQAIPNGSFVCEFEGNLLSRHECEEAEGEYEKEKKAVYILGVCYPCSAQYSRCGDIVSATGSTHKMMIFKGRMPWLIYTAGITGLVGEVMCGQYNKVWMYK